MKKACNDANLIKPQIRGTKKHELRIGIRRKQIQIHLSFFFNCLDTLAENPDPQCKTEKNGHVLLSQSRQAEPRYTNDDKIITGQKRSGT